MHGNACMYIYIGTACMEMHACIYRHCMHGIIHAFSLCIVREYSPLYFRGKKFSRENFGLSPSQIIEYMVIARRAGSSSCQ